ncbi:MAG: addiction module protein [Methylobacter sp.]
MPTQFEILEAEVLKLVPAERALLAEHIIASLGEDNEIESAWAVEVERRVAEIDRGAVVGMPRGSDRTSSCRFEVKNPAAGADLNNAAAFYSEQANRQLGLALITEFEKAASLLSGNPELGTPWGSGTRRFVLRRFYFSKIVCFSIK